MRDLLYLIAALPLAAAWPAVMDNLEKRGVAPKVPPPAFSSGRDQCGVHGPCAGFDEEEQFVDVTKSSGHAFQRPKSTDERGQCPGLNAAANHGFLPRNGIATIAQTIDGLGAAYNMAPDLAGVLAVLSIAICGDPIAGTWSIGGSYPGTLGLLGQPSGILGTHNRYEGDASIVRGDAYLYNGNVDVFEMQKWNYLYSLVGSNGFTSDDAAKMAYWTSEYSVINNPSYFSGPFSGLVAPDAHNFVTNLMSNHSAGNPGGILTAEVLMSFFAITGSPGKFVHHKYQERIPYAWYKRPLANAFTAVDTNADTVINNQIYPGVIRFGGNLGKKNTFTGVDLGDLTGGVYNSQNIFQGDNLSCFFLQATQQTLLDFSDPLVQPLGVLKRYLAKHLAPQFKALNCPQLKSFNGTVFKPYPGASYKAEGE